MSRIAFHIAEICGFLLYRFEPSCQYLFLPAAGIGGKHRQLPLVVETLLGESQHGTT